MDDPYVLPIQKARLIARRIPCSIKDRAPPAIEYPKAKAPMLQEVFNLDEGPVTLIFPESLSADSYEDLASYFQLFLRKAKRRTLQGVEARGITGKDIAGKDEEAAN